MAERSKGAATFLSWAGGVWVRIPLETYIFILNFSLLPRSEQVNGAVANEIKHVHSPEVIVVLDPRYDLSYKALYISTCSIALIPVAIKATHSAYKHNHHTWIFQFYKMFFHYKTSDPSHAHNKTSLFVVTFVRISPFSLYISRFTRCASLVWQRKLELQRILNSIHAF